jgi:hypothetical protein
VRGVVARALAASATATAPDAAVMAPKAIMRSRRRSKGNRSRTETAQEREARQALHASRRRATWGQCAWKLPGQ